MSTILSSTTISEDLLKEDCLLLASGFIVIYNLDLPRPTALEDISSSYFVRLFEKVFHFPVPDLFLVKDTEDEVHNLQSLIDTLSLDILSISLSHISAEDIVLGKVHSIHNLLEVFEGYLSYCDGTIEKEDETSSPPEEVSDPSQSVNICGFCGFQRKPSSQPIATTSRGMPFDLRRCPVCSNTVKMTDLPLDAEKIQRMLSRSLPSTDDLAQATQKQASTSFESSSSNGSTTQPKRVKTRAQIPMPGLFARFEEDRAVPGTSQQAFFPTATERRVSGSVTPTLSERETRARARDLMKRLLEESEAEEEEEDDVDRVIKIPFQKVENKATQTPPKLLAEVEKPGVLAEQSNVLTIAPMKRQRPVVYSSVDVLKEMYAKNYEAKVCDYLTDKTQHRQKADDIKKVYLKSLKKPYRKSQSPMCRKSFLLPCPLRHRSHPTPTKPGYKPLWNKKTAAFDEGRFLEELQELFPNSFLSNGTKRRMAREYRKHLLQMHKNLKEALDARSRTQMLSEEALKRQQVVNDMLRKELERKQKRSDMQLTQSLQRQLRSQCRDARINSAKVHQHNKEFGVEETKKVDNLDLKEQELMQTLFKDRLKADQEQVRQLIRMKKQRDKEIGEEFRKCNDNLNNLYQSQFDLVSESLATELQSLDSRNEDQRRAMEALRRENRSRTLEEIRNHQANIRRTREDMLHFKELDAQQYRERMFDRINKID